MKSESENFPIGLQSLLQYHALIGIRHYPRNASVESFLRVVPRLTGKTARAREKSLGRAVPGVPGKRRDAPLESPARLADIEAEVVSCHACDLHKQRLYPVPGRGSDKIRLLLVGDWLAANTQDVLPPGHLFGVAQDQMLSKMLTAINLSADDVFITNVIKCAVPDTCQPQAVHVQSCSSFLRRQIVALLPEVICAMGTVAARAVLRKSQPLSRLRGQFHEYEVEQGKTIPVIATYHPSYLLQNPEMKQATWTDLQMLAKRLGLS